VWSVYSVGPTPFCMPQAVCSPSVLITAAVLRHVLGAMLHSPVLCRRSSTHVWCFIIGVVIAPGLRAAPQFARDSQLVDHVFDLIDRRLALMPEVAAWKYRQQRPIADLARERDVIEQSSADAEAIHLDREAARAFFSAQIVLARAIQAQLFREWESRNETPPTARDLGTEIRPQLDAIGRELLPAVYLASIALSETPSRAVRSPNVRPACSDIRVQLENSSTLWFRPSPRCVSRQI
jgi:chorismate mutase-like protein